MVFSNNIHTTVYFKLVRLLSKLVLYKDLTLLKRKSAANPFIYMNNMSCRRLCHPEHKPKLNNWAPLCLNF